MSAERRLMDIVSRAQWGARHEDGFGSAPLPAREVWLHHSVTVAPDLVAPFDDEDQAMRTLERIGEQRFGRGISYTFAVMPTGRVYEGHGVARQGAHTGGRNSIARAIVLVGNYDTTPPTPAQVESTARLLVHGHRQGWWSAARLAGGHQQAPGASTACPGRHAMAAIRQINDRAAALLAGAPPLQEDDMPRYLDWSPEDRRALAMDIWRYADETVVNADNQHEPTWAIHRLVGIDRAVWQAKDAAEYAALGVDGRPHRDGRRSPLAELLTGGAVDGQLAEGVLAGVQPAAPGAPMDDEQLARVLARPEVAGAFARAFADEQDRRARDGDPATGPVT
ncbi:N-acetylmuramoyl-L-alanine amidase [Blastococcus sp. BMG 814]|uniref:N-acetylmuramoyl-L-alanine amidase n=1 Tax=Blastococcus carthaginiensis TaxID=3050034 RepID=A0ABT9I9C9_9ACTN|nr:N-acetylmuramoyl-L-alanine amidase [Blastococcus carthaginiensis]MDP5182188.1 N-acetylmuramoyl-L-alanine amidase [Blastococcus carthaginiensis]